MSHVQKNVIDVINVINVILADFLMINVIINVICVTRARHECHQLLVLAVLQSSSWRNDALAEPMDLYQHRE